MRLEGETAIIPYEGNVEPMRKWQVAVNDQDKVNNAEINVDLVEGMTRQDKTKVGPLECRHVQLSEEDVDGEIAKSVMHPRVEIGSGKEKRRRRANTHLGGYVWRNINNRAEGERGGIGKEA